LFRQSAALQDEQRRVDAQHIAQQQAMDDRAAWTAYMRALDARAPRTVYLHCGGAHAGATEPCPTR
jgi:hypothetical protein